MAMTKERRKQVVDKVLGMSEEEQKKIFFSVQLLLKSKKVNPNTTIFPNELVNETYDELPEIREIMASIVMITQTDLTTRALQDAGCLRGKK